MSSSNNPGRMERWKSAAVNQLQPVKPLPAPALLALVLWITCTVYVGASLFVLRANGWQVMTPVQRWGTWLAISIAGALFAWMLAIRMTPGSRPRVNANLAFTLLLAGVLFLLSQLMPDQHHADLMGQGLRCLRVNIPNALVTLLLLRLILRQGYVIPSRATAAVAGALAGIVGLAILELHCPNTDRWHVLLAHASVAVVFGVLGWCRPRLFLS